MTAQDPQPWPADEDDQPWPPDQWSGLLIGIGRVLFNWNNVERLLTQMVIVLSGAGERGRVVATHLGNNSQVDVAKTLATEFLPEEERENILHALRVYDRLKDRRNYYVHSFGKISAPGGVPSARLESWSARGKLRYLAKTVTTEELEAEALLMKRASGYFSHLQLALESEGRHPWPNRMEIPALLLKPGQDALDDRPSAWLA